MAHARISSGERRARWALIVSKSSLESGSLRGVRIFEKVMAKMQLWGVKLHSCKYLKGVRFRWKVNAIRVTGVLINYIVIIYCSHVPEGLPESEASSKCLGLASDWQSPVTSGISVRTIVQYRGN